MKTVADLRKQLIGLDGNLPIIMENENGKRFHLLTCKKRSLSTRKPGITHYCWLPVGDKVNFTIDFCGDKISCQKQLHRQNYREQLNRGSDG